MELSIREKTVLSDCYVRKVNMPRTIGGFATPNDDGTFNIYINAAISEHKQQAALRHELQHIGRDHFYQQIPIEQMEAEADEKY